MQVIGRLLHVNTFTSPCRGWRDVEWNYREGSSLSLRVGCDSLPIATIITLYCLVEQQKLAFAYYKLFMYPPPRQVYLEDYSCIIDSKQGRGGLYIGNLEAAQNINTLKKHQIKALLTAAKGIEISHPKSEVPYFLYIPADDHESFDISRYFHLAASFINDCLQRTNIMVHCLAGVSRSVSLVIAYLIKHRNMSYSQSYELVKSRRKIIQPNEGFIQALKKLEKTIPRSASPSKHSIYSRQNHQHNLSTQEHSQSLSPSKSKAITNFQSRLHQFDRYRQANLSLHDSPTKNPELYFNYKKNQSVSPQKQGTLRIDSSKEILKNVPSMKARNESGWNNTSYQLRDSSRLRSSSDYNPLLSIQNKSQYGNANSDIDRKIQEIRKKYQQISSGGYSAYSKLYTNKYDENIRGGLPSNTYASEKMKDRQYYATNYDHGQIRRNISTANASRMKKISTIQQY